MNHYTLIGASAAALLMVDLVPPAQATTGQEPATASTATVGTAAASTPAPLPEATPAPSTGSETPVKPVGETAETQPEPAKPKPLPPSLVARINLTSQTMSVQAGGKTIHTWKVSSGAPGYATPPGTFKPGWMSKMWYSRQYDDAPMPHSVFFNGGIAVHGTSSIGNLGRAASHGCVRLAPANAARFYQLVSKHGMAMTRIIVTGPQPFSTRTERVARGNSGRGNRTSHSLSSSPSRNGNIRIASRSRPTRLDYGYTGPAPRYTAVRSPAPYWSRY